MINYCRDHLINRKYKIKWKRITENVSELICSKNNISESKPLNISVYVMMFPNNLPSFLCCIRSFLPCWHCCSCALSCGHTGTGYQGSVGGCLCAVPYRPLLQFTWSITTTGSDLIPHFFIRAQVLVFDCIIWTNCRFIFRPVPAWLFLPRRVYKSCSFEYNWLPQEWPLSTGSLLPFWNPNASALPSRQYS